jgi:hypothetical protein
MAGGKTLAAIQGGRPNRNPACFHLLGSFDARHGFVEPRQSGRRDIKEFPPTRRQLNLPGAIEKTKARLTFEFPD